ncbi:MAG: hypothetical protein L6Q54_11935 [Leptospiraceae bacterium]|nr:hypothetical protein [Leptospiraceae bacterium]MCK6381940.1 hypothetical protein [Leptospiraceae bacterium]NUM42086.1 hypothetical protein [Leptospiraceae bacterium]
MRLFTFPLAQDVQIKEWKEVTWKFPEIDIYTFLWIALFFILAGLSFYIANLIKNSQAKTYERWKVLKAGLRKFHFTTHEYEILRHFFLRLPFKDKMSSLIFSDPEFTKVRLLDFLEKFPEEDYVNKIELLTKLYSEEYQKEEIKNLSDIHLGEFCYLVFSNQRVLSYIKKVEGDQVSLKIFPLYYLYDLRYPNIFLEFFRKKRGKYSIKGVFHNSRKGDTFFKPTGEFEFLEISYGHESDEASQEEENYEIIQPELRNCLNRILDYSEIEVSKRNIFLENLDIFRNLKDKFSNIEAARVVRSNISLLFFPIYEQIFKKFLKDKNAPECIDNFLEYCFMDEKLLYPSQIQDLVSIPKKFNPQEITIYTLREWLLRIYNLIDEPSVNELGQSFQDVNKLKRIKGFISEEEEKNFLNSTDRRLNFEIENVFKSVHKLCYGTPSVYFPVLHKDMVTKLFSKSKISTEQIQKGLDDALKIDFSLFHRETNYSNEAKNISKEIVMTRVLPEFVIVPTYGSRCIMWQEVTMRKRNSSGRFFIPQFTADNLYLMLLRSFGIFRWELNKTLQGRFWNDITSPSLTSEYYDYLSYYRKNKNLSLEAREKIRQQIIKYRKNIRDIFASDYLNWMLFESKGVPRLNKVSRSIFYRYCPFPKEIRNTLLKQPIYSDIAEKFNNLRLKKIESLENHYFNIKKNIGTLPQELQKNLEFYKDL